jgi:hypothetical protein
MNKIISFIDHLYETINIYQTIILYNNKYEISELVNILSSKDYPVCIISTNDNENIIQKENKFRVFIMDNDTFLNHYIQTKKLDLTMLSVIMCLDKISHQKICNYLNLNNAINLAEELYIFSIDNI